MYLEKKDQHVTSKITESLYRDLDELAKEHRLGISAMIRWILEEEVPKRRELKNKPPLFTSNQLG